MRLEVSCEDRLGLTRELLDRLVEHNIDLRGIEIDTSGIIYLNFPELEFRDFQHLMPEIRRIPGVYDVKTIPYMPSEREHHEIEALLKALPDLVFSLDAKGKVPKLKNREMLLFADTVAGRPGEVQLVAPGAQLDFTPELEARLRPILTELYAPEAPARITGISDTVRAINRRASSGVMWRSRSRSRLCQWASRSSWPISVGLRRVSWAKRLLSAPCLRAVAIEDIRNIERTR